MSEQPDQININAASKEQLVTLPGIGDALADRILAARPYSSLDGLKEVEGIGETMFEQLSTKITLADSDDSDSQLSQELPQDQIESEDKIDTHDPSQEEGIEPIQPETSGEDLEPSSSSETAPPSDEERPIEPESTLPEEQQPEQDDMAKGTSGSEKIEVAPKPAKVEEPDISQKVSADTASQQSKFITRGCMFWLMVGMTIIAVILSVLVSLGIIIAVNGGLEYVSPREFVTLKRQVDGLTAQVNRIDSDLNDLYIRMENMESLSGRLGQLENNLAKAQKQIEDSDAQFEELTTAVGDLAEQVEELQTDTTRFSNFLDGLRKLLTGDASS